MYKVGDPVVYTVSKHTSNPGRRAKNVTPEPKGEFYSYDVDKFRTVARVDRDGKLVLLTPTGKERTVIVGDSRLRHARWWERWLYRDRFPHLRSMLVNQETTSWRRWKFRNSFRGAGKTS